jgi:hypothetical protein
MAFSCFGVSGCASGSLFAAAVIALSSFAVGMTTTGRLEIFDIVFHLATIGAAQANDPSHLATVYKCHEHRISVFGASAIIRVSSYSNRYRDESWGGVLSIATNFSSWPGSRSD